MKSTLARLLRTPARSRRVRLALTGLEDRVTPTHTFTVTTTAVATLPTGYPNYPNYVQTNLSFDAQGNAFNADGKPITLAEAMFANSYFNFDVPFYPGPNIINFNVPGAGVHVFHGSPAVPGAPFEIAGQSNCTINGFSQLGSKANTAAFGQPSNAQITIEFDGRLEITVGSNTVRGISARGVDIYGDTNPFSNYGLPNNNTVAGCYLGVHANGFTSWGDTQEGVYIAPAHTGNTVGGPNAADRNVIAGHVLADPHFGNVGRGVYLGTDGNTVQGNYIGTAADGKTRIGDLMSGVQIGTAGGNVAKNNTVFQNIIAFNSQYGVEIDNGTGNKVAGNWLFGNTKGGITLAAGTNNGVPTPVLTSVDGTSVTGTLAGVSAATPYTVEFFTSTAKDAAGQYEGQTPMGTFQVTASPFTIDVPNLTTGFITVTATDNKNDTSAFSNALPAGAGLLVKSVTSTAPDIATPGLACTVTVTVSNKTGAELDAAGGTQLIKLYTGPDKKYLLGEYDVPAGGTEKLLNGGLKSYFIKFNFPDIGDAGQIDPGTYQYYAELDSSFRGKTGSSAKTFDFANQFGTVEGKPNVVLKVREPAGQGPARQGGSGPEVTFSVVGPGTGTVSMPSGNVSVQFTGTTAASTATATVAGGAIGSVQTITATSPLGFLNIPNLNLTGTATFSGGLGNLKANSLGGNKTSQAQLTISKATATQAPATLTFTTIDNAAIEADAGIQGLWINAWTDSDPGSPDAITAPFVSQIYDVKVAPVANSGTFAAGLKLTGKTRAGYGVDIANIGGPVSGVWDLGPGGASSITADSAAKWQITTTGPVNNLTVTKAWDNTGLAGPVLTAKTIGVMTVKQLTGPEIDVTGAALGIGVSSLNIGEAKLDKLSVTGGGITRLIGHYWSDSTGSGNMAITAPWADMIQLSKDPTAPIPTRPSSLYADVHLTGAKGKTDVSLIDLSVDNLAGSLTAFADVDQIIADVAYAGWSMVGGEDSGSPGTLLLLLKIGDMRGSVRTSAIGTVYCSEDMTGSLAATLPVPITTIVAGDVSGDISAFGGINTLIVGNWNGGTLTAGPVKSLRILGTATNVTFNLLAGASLFQAAQLIGCTVDATGQPIGIFYVLGIAGKAKPNFDATRVTAGKMGVVVIRDVGESQVEAAYGIKATGVVVYVRYAGLIAAKTVHLGTDPQVYDQDANYSFEVIP